MTEKQFAKYAYRHSEIIIFHQQHPEEDVECMLLAVDFDYGTFKLAPIDTENYEDKSIYVSYEHCDKPTKGKEIKMIVKGETKKVKLHPKKKQYMTMDKVCAKWEDCIYCKVHSFPAPPSCMRQDNWVDCKMCMGKKCKYFTTKKR